MKSYQGSIFPIIYWGLIFSGTKEKSVRVQSEKRDFKIFRASYLPMSFQQLLQNSTTAGFLLHVDDSVMCSCGVRQEREAICSFPINPVFILGSKESANFILFSSDLRRKGMLLGTLLNSSFILVLVFPLNLYTGIGKTMQGELKWLRKPSSLNIPAIPPCCPQEVEITEILPYQL